MSDNDIVLSVVDDPGIKAWLDRVIEEPFRVEFVSRADLTRVLRLLEATTPMWCWWRSMKRIWINPWRSLPR